MNYYETSDDSSSGLEETQSKRYTEDTESEVQLSVQTCYTIEDSDSVDSAYNFNHVSRNSECGTIPSYYTTLEGSSESSMYQEAERSLSPVYPDKAELIQTWIEIEDSMALGNLYDESQADKEFHKEHHNNLPGQDDSLVHIVLSSGSEATVIFDKRNPSHDDRHDDAIVEQQIDRASPLTAVVVRKRIRDWIELQDPLARDGSVHYSPNTRDKSAKKFREKWDSVSIAGHEKLKIGKSISSNLIPLTSSSKIKKHRSKPNWEIGKQQTLTEFSINLKRDYNKSSDRNLTYPKKHKKRYYSLKTENNLQCAQIHKETKKISKSKTKAKFKNKNCNNNEIISTNVPGKLEKIKIVIKKPQYSKNNVMSSNYCILNAAAIKVSNPEANLEGNCVIENIEEERCAVESNVLLIDNNVPNNVILGNSKDAVVQLPLSSLSRKPRAAGQNPELSKVPNIELCNVIDITKESSSASDASADATNNTSGFGVTQDAIIPAPMENIPHITRSDLNTGSVFEEPLGKAVIDDQRIQTSNSVISVQQQNAVQDKQPLGGDESIISIQLRMIITHMCAIFMDKIMFSERVGTEQRLLSDLVRPEFYKLMIEDKKRIKEIVEIINCLCKITNTMTNPLDGKVVQDLLFDLICYRFRNVSYRYTLDMHADILETLSSEYAKTFGKLTVNNNVWCSQREMLSSHFVANKTDQAPVENEPAASAITQRPDSVHSNVVSAAAKNASQQAANLSNQLSYQMTPQQPMHHSISITSQQEQMYPAKQTAPTDNVNHNEVSSTMDVASNLRFQLQADSTFSSGSRHETQNSVSQNADTSGFVGSHVSMQLRLSSNNVHRSDETQVGSSTVVLSYPNSDVTEKDPSFNISEADNQNCAHCDISAQLMCGRCIQSPYCSRECQKLHWFSHHMYTCRTTKPVPDIGN